MSEFILTPTKFDMYFAACEENKEALKLYNSQYSQLRSDSDILLSKPEEFGSKQRLKETR